MSDLQEITAGVYVAEAPQRFMGLEVGARMTVLALDGGLFVHSPLPLDPAALEAVGEPRWVLAPNLFHHLYAGAWASAGLEVWAAPGLPDKRPDVEFRGVITGDHNPFGDELRVLALSCFPLSNEVVVLHQPSRTLIVTDLVFNLPASAPWATRAAFRCLCGYPGCRSTLLERFGMQRDAARRELAILAEWEFDRLIMAHGTILETGGREALLGAFRWLA
jgi:hypothetical protein